MASCETINDSQIAHLQAQGAQWLLAQVSPGVKHKSVPWRENTSYINFRRKVRVVSVSFSYSFCV